MRSTNSTSVRPTPRFSGATRVTAFVVVLVAVTACGGASQTADSPSDTDATAEPESETPGRVTPEQWQLLVLGDSYFTDRTSIARSVGVYWAELVEEDLGVEVEVDYPMVGGQTPAQLLQTLQEYEELRDQVREAEAVFFDVPLGGMDRRCGPDHVPPEEIASCMAAELATYTEQAAAVMDAILALRSTDEAIIRVGDAWQFAQPQLQALGVYEDVTEQWQRYNQAVADAARDRGIPVVHAYDAFSPTEAPDPVAAGYVSHDEVHLSEMGAHELARMFFETGYAPLR